MNSTPMQLLATGNVAPVPIILGSNSDEGTGFMANDSSMTYPLALNTSGEEWIDWLGSAFMSRGIFNYSDVPQVCSVMFVLQQSFLADIAYECFHPEGFEWQQLDTFLCCLHSAQTSLSKVE